jgi:hypothetical protein
MGACFDAMLGYFGRPGSAVALAAVTLGASMLLNCGGQSQAPPSNISIVCAADVGEPGKPITSGAKICNDVTLGAQVLSVDFASDGAASDLAEIYPATGVNDIHEAATFASGVATLHSGGSDQEAIMTPVSWLHATAPANVVIVADFEHLSADSLVGVSPRCTDDGCILVAVGADGKYVFSQRVGTKWTYPLQGDLNADTSFPAPRLNGAGENRLIVWLNGREMGATLNGRLLGTAKLNVPAIKEAFLYHRSLNANQATQVGVTRIYFFAAQ